MSVFNEMGQLLTVNRKRAAQIREAAGLGEITRDDNPDDGMAVAVLLSHLIAEHNEKHGCDEANLRAGCAAMGELVLAEAIAHRNRIRATLPKS